MMKGAFGEDFCSMMQVIKHVVQQVVVEVVLSVDVPSACNDDDTWSGKCKYLSRLVQLVGLVMVF